MSEKTPAASLAAAVAEGFTMPEGTEVDSSEAPAVVETTPVATEGAQPVVESTVETTGTTEDPAAAAAEVTDDLPDSYFEVDLSGLPAEEKQAILAALKARDDEIGKLLRGAPKETPPADGATTPAGEPVAAPEPMSDEDILKALNLDPENPFDENGAKVALPLVRGLQALQEQVAGLIEERELEQLDRYWTGTLDKLEADNGVLPIDRTAVLEYAAANGLQTPEQAYWQISGPAREQVARLTAEARKRLATPTEPVEPAVKKPTSTRPAAGGGTEAVPTSQPTIKGAVKEEASKVLRDLGIGD